VGTFKLGRNGGDELHRTRASPGVQRVRIRDAKSSPDTATAVIRARLAAGASLAQSCRLWARVRRPRSPDHCRQFALLTSVVETNPDLSRRALDHDAVPAHHRVARHTTRHSRSVGSGASRGQCHGPNEILRHSWSVKRDKAPHAPWTDAVCRHWRSSLTALEPERTKSPSMQPQRAPARGAGCLGPLFLAAIRPSATVGVRP